MSDTASTQSGTTESRRHADKKSTSWIVGVVLIILGITFFLENAGLLALTGNWWAIFIYLASAASFANAYRSYRATGVFGAATTGSLTWGVVLALVASIFLFNLLWEQWWPAILVAIGIGIIVGNLLGSQGRGPGDRYAS